MKRTHIGIPYGESGAAIPVQKFRDGFKCLSGMTDRSAAYLLLGVEDQSQIHYAMPVKDMVYDALQYSSQVEEAAKSHRKNRKNPDSSSGLSPGEYLSGFYRTDKLIPVITLVIYFGPDRWDGPVSLHEMMSTTDPNILSFVPDYRINLITPESMEEEELNLLHTNLREVLLFIKYSKDKQKLNALVSQDPRFKEVDIQAGRVINSVTGSELKFDKNEEVVDMCKAIQDIREDARDEGRKEGRKEIIANMLKKNNYSCDEIAELLDVSVKEVQDTAAKMNL